MGSITLRSLTKRFETIVAVDKLSLETQDGELITLLGPSEWGKTTTLRLLSGFESPDDGTILFGGQRVERLPPEDRNVGLVFQNYALFPHMTVFQNIAFGLEMRHESAATIRDRVAAILEKTRMPKLGERFPHQLSGGQKQRVALARALVINPRPAIARRTACKSRCQAPRGDALLHPGSPKRVSNHNHLRAD